jgi:tetratricopeptide (TPR) repeat protein
MKPNLKKKLILTNLFIFFLTLTVFVLSYIGLNEKNSESIKHLELRNSLLKITWQIENWKKNIESESNLFADLKKNQKALNDILNQQSLYNYTLFNRNAKKIFDAGDISLPENFKPSSSKEELTSFWQSISGQFTKEIFYLENTGEWEAKYYLPIFHENKIPSSILLVRLDPPFFKKITRFSSPTFLLRLLLGIILILCTSIAALLMQNNFLVKPVHIISQTLAKFNEEEMDIRLGFKLHEGEFGQISEYLDQIAENYHRLQEDNEQYSLERKNYEVLFESQSFMISEIQANIKSALESIELRNFDLHIQQSSMGNFSGNICDIIQLDSGETIFFMMDTSSHTIASALFTLTIRQWLKNILTNEKNPAVIMRILREKSAKAITAPIQISCLIMSLTPQESSIKYVNAGFPAGFIIHQKGSSKVLAQANFPVISVGNLSSDSEFRELETDSSDTSLLGENFSEGDTLVLFTGGVLQNLDKNPKAITEELMNLSGPAAKSMTPKEVAEETLKKIMALPFNNGVEAGDTTVFVIQKKAAGAMANGKISTKKEDGLAKQPEKPFTKLLANGKAAYHKKEFSKALELLAEYLKSNENDLEALIYYSDTLMHLAQNEKALTYYQKIKPFVSDDPDIHFKIGLINYRLENFEESAREMEQAIELRTSYGDAWLYAGVIHANQGNYDQAMTILNRALKEGIYEEETSKLLAQISEMKKTSV